MSKLETNQPKYHNIPMQREERRSERLRRLSRVPEVALYPVGCTRNIPPRRGSGVGTYPKPDSRDDLTRIMRMSYRHVEHFHVDRHVLHLDDVKEPSMTTLE